MKLLFAGILAFTGVVSLTACAVQRAETAQKAQVQMVGLSKERVLACMGVPAEKMTEGSTEVWAYNSGDGHTEGSVVASGGNGFATGFGVSKQRFCKVNIVITNGAVSKVNYAGPTGGLLTSGEQCSFAVQNCTGA